MILCFNDGTKVTIGAHRNNKKRVAFDPVPCEGGWVTYVYYWERLKGTTYVQRSRPVSDLLVIIP